MQERARSGVFSDIVPDAFAKGADEWATIPPQPRLAPKERARTWGTRRDAGMQERACSGVFSDIVPDAFAKGADEWAAIPP